MKNKIFLFSLLIFLAGLFFAYTGRREKGGNPISNFESSKEEIMNIFEREGAEKAYAFFKDKYSAADETLSHELAHFVGIQIYANKGVEGISICDSTQNWGCYHGFFGAALKKEGKSFLNKAGEACAAGNGSPLDFGGCVHGIGHGVLSLSGYELGNLREALETCDLLSDTAMAKGCYNGVFMEYNTRTMQPAGLNPIREFDPLDAFHPCDAIPQSYQADCYFEQPSWWAIVMPKDFVKIANYCQEVRDTASRDICFSGLGRIVPSKVSYDKAEVGKACSTMPSAFFRYLCMKEAIKILQTDVGKDALELCDLLDSPYGQRCIIESKEYRCSVVGICD